MPAPLSTILSFEVFLRHKNKTTKSNTNKPQTTPTNRPSVVLSCTGGNENVRRRYLQKENRTSHFPLWSAINCPSWATGAPVCLSEILLLSYAWYSSPEICITRIFPPPSKPLKYWHKLISMQGKKKKHVVSYFINSLPGRKNNFMFFKCYRHFFRLFFCPLLT